MNLPIPETRSGWLASIFLIVTLFVVYYRGVYQLNLDYYRSQYTGASFNNFSVQSCHTSEKLRAETPAIAGTVIFTPTSTPEVVTVPTDTPNNGTTNSEEIVDNCETSWWSLVLKIPSYVSYAAPGWIYFELKNEDVIDENTNAEGRDVTLGINLSGEKLNLLPSMYKDDAFVRVVEQNKLAPGASLYGRIYFGGNQIVDMKECDQAIEKAFYINGTLINTQAEGNLSCPRNDVVRSLSRAIVENILLPPWTNAIIPAISLLICYLLETNSKAENKTDASLLVFWKNTLSIYILSLTSAIVIGVVLERFLLSKLDSPEGFVTQDHISVLMRVVNVLLILLSSYFLAALWPMAKLIWRERANIHKRLSVVYKDGVQRLKGFRKK